MGNGRGNATSDVAIRKNRYYDSVFLMSVASRLAKLPGIEDAAAVMGTANNRKMLLDLGFNPAGLGEAAPNDLVIALHGEREAVRKVLGDIDSHLVRGADAVSSISASSWREALTRQPASNVALVSVPGHYAAREADVALDAGLNVFLFSDHVAAAEELALKRKASEAGLIVMGPDCGTAIVAGIGLGFANVVRRGPIGVVASSGTGLQEFTCLVHRAGSGISHALGTGSRDLSDAIGGISTLAAVRALERDQGTRAIVVLSKPPGARTLPSLMAVLAGCSKPTVVCLLGAEAVARPRGSSTLVAHTLDEAAAMALRAMGASDLSAAAAAVDVRGWVGAEAERMSSEQKYIRGLFAGGTFCYQAQQILRDRGMTAGSNAPLRGMHAWVEGDACCEHTLVDMGADEFTEGRPHPMIDATQRRAHVLAVGEEAEAAVLLLDVILGYGAAQDPAGDLADAIRRARAGAERRGRHLAVIASVCGTDGDPQGLEDQEATLRDAGALVCASNAQATRAACDVIRKIARRTEAK
jgi:succinyl-CoA synthetase alpha subunit